MSDDRRRSFDDDDDYNNYDRPRDRRGDAYDDYDDGPRGPSGARRKTWQQAKDSVMIPAYGLMITGGIALLLQIASMVVYILSYAGVAIAGIQNANDLEFVGRMVGSVIGICWHSTIILSGYKMMNLQSKVVIWIGCIFASIPCCSPCLIFGMPFGIWGIVLLCNEDTSRHIR